MSFSKRTNPLPIEDLKPGMSIIAIEAQNGPVKLRKSGLVKSQDMVNGLKEMGVLSLNIDWDNSIEMDDTAPDSMTSAISPDNQLGMQQSPMNTRHLFNDEHKNDVQNAMSDQFNRSLFLPSLQALPSQFSVMGKYVAQYVGIIGLGLILGYGAAHLLPNQHQPVVASNIEVTAPEATLENKPDNPLITESDNLVIPEVDSPLNNEMDTKLENEDKTTQQVNLEQINEDVGVLVTQQSDIAPASAAMAARVNQALASLGGLDELKAAAASPDELQVSIPKEPETSVEVVDQIQGVAQLPERILVQLPAMVFSAHMYSSTDEDRWVRVNNRRLQEGGRVDANVKVVRIEPQYVVLSFRGTEFKMAALTDW